jgi:hypothetical protein
MVFEIAGVQVEGDRLNGEKLGAAAADWVTVGPEGTGTLDIRETIRTDDGATISVQYQGKLDRSKGMQFPMTAYVASRFETSDERYAWLNRIQAVGKGPSTRTSRSTMSGTRFANARQLSNAYRGSRRGVV